MSGFVRCESFWFIIHSFPLIELDDIMEYTILEWALWINNDARDDDNDDDDGGDDDDDDDESNNGIIKCSVF